MIIRRLLPIAATLLITSACDGGADDAMLPGPHANAVDEPHRTPAQQMGVETLTTEIPTTAAGARLEWTLDVLNTSAYTLTGEDLQPHFMPSVFETVTADEILEDLQVAYNYGPCTFVGYDEAPSNNSGEFIVGCGGGYRTITIETGPKPEMLMTRLLLNTYPRRPGQ